MSAVLKNHIFKESWNTWGDVHNNVEKEYVTLYLDINYCYYLLQNSHTCLSPKILTMDSSVSGEWILEGNLIAFFFFFQCLKIFYRNMLFLYSENKKTLLKEKKKYQYWWVKKLKRSHATKLPLKDQKAKAEESACHPCDIRGDYTCSHWPTTQSVSSTTQSLSQACEPAMA